MTNHIIPAAFHAQRSKKVPNRERTVAVSLDVPRGSGVVGTNTWRTLDENHIEPQQVATELYRLAVMSYTADSRLSRTVSSDRWSRDIVIHLPVSDDDLWNRAIPVVEELLGFLTGDRWRVLIFKEAWDRPARDEAAWKRSAEIKTQTISLFSGGLDSFIGAVDLLAKGSNVALVGHYDNGSTKKVQSDLAAALDGHFPSRARLLQFMIQPAGDLTGETEPTSRSRSFLFFSLAVLAASGLGATTAVSIPENGFIALNPPLTGTRLGPLSTRTTHPHTIHLFRLLLATLIPSVTSVATPYAAKTKGEMVTATYDRDFLEQYATGTMSCSHPNVGRWQKRSAFQHCGYCVPCIIRRAALRMGGLDRSRDYRVDVLSRSPDVNSLEDVRALLVAIERSTVARPISALLRAGPLSDDIHRIPELLAVYTRGLLEVAEFLSLRKKQRL